MKLSNSTMAACAALALASAGHATAGANLIQNGDFSSNNLANTVTGQSVTYRYAPSSVITGWTYTVPGGSSANNGGIITVLNSNNLNSSHNMVDTCCSLGLWNKSNGGLSVITAPPSGNPFVLGQDTAPENAAYLSQTIGGLVVGKTYQLTFSYAGVQLYGFDGTEWNGATNVGVQANLGGTYDTSAPGGTMSETFIGGQTDVVTYKDYTPAVPSHGFSGWRHGVMQFTATATSEVLNIEAISTSTGNPPFALLDNFQMSAVPEPATWALMLIGVGGLGAVSRRRRALPAAGPVCDANL